MPANGNSTSVPVPNKTISARGRSGYLWWQALSVVVGLFLVTYPLFDPDLYWHLANGRAMVETKQIVNEEIFSYTHRGQPFVNHEWLAQVIFFLFWRYGGVIGLYVVKAAVVSSICVLVHHTAYKTCRNSRAAGGLTALAILAGVDRYHVRPELFSLLGTALLVYILNTYNSAPRMRFLLWAIPVLFLVWDCLHGAIVGTVLLLVFVLVENVTHLRSSGRTPRAVQWLNAAAAVAVAASAISPYGLRTYEHFRILASSSHGADRIIELQPMWVDLGAHVPFLLLVFVAISLAIANRHRANMTSVLLVGVFAASALRYNRLSGMAAIVIVAAVAQFVAPTTGNLRQRTRGRVSRWAAPSLIVAGCIVAAQVKFAGMHGTTAANGTYVLPSPTALGVGMNEKMTPAGSVRFILDKGITGNMYNNANLAGYLCYYLAPGRPIFQYNMPPIFGDTTRFVKHPGDLDKWHVDYALAGSPGELTHLFPSERWAWIYSDYVSTLVVRRTPEHQALIDTYEIRYFAPEQPIAQYNLISADARARPRLAFEMGVYLAYMSDDRIADRLRQLVEAHPGLYRVPGLPALIAKAGAHNPALRMLPAAGGNG